MELPTIRVKHPDPAIGVMIINESDYDPAIHQLADADGDESSMPRRRRVVKVDDD